MKGYSRPIDALFKGNIVMSYNIRNIVAKIMNEINIFVFILIAITVILLETPAMKGFRPRIVGAKSPIRRREGAIVVAMLKSQIFMNQIFDKLPPAVHSVLASWRRRVQISSIF